MSIKPTAQGIFYPNEKKAILKLFSSYHKHECTISSKLAIVPHAGYEFSGEIAFQTYNCLNKTTENVMVIAPAIYNKIYGHYTCDEKSFSTPLGGLQIKASDCEINNPIFTCESSLGVQLPLIKHFFPKSKIIPIIYGCEDYNVITEIIENNIKSSVIILPTNLSRFIPEREAIKLDNQTSRLINKLQTTDLDIELADGAVGLCAAITYAQKHNMKFVQTGLTNSSKVNGDTSNVVGYGGWYLITR